MRLPGTYRSLPRPSSQLKPSYPFSSLNKTKCYLVSYYVVSSLIDFHPQPTIASYFVEYNTTNKYGPIGNRTRNLCLSFSVKNKTEMQGQRSNPIELWARINTLSKTDYLNTSPGGFSKKTRRPFARQSRPRKRCLR